MKICKLSVKEANVKYINGEFTAVEMVKECLEKAEEFKSKNAVIEVFEDAILLAEKLDEKRASGEKLGRLAGVAVTIKDNILYNGKKATACSKFLKNFTATYTATALQKMLEEDAIVIGRTNMDEFTLGSDGESSIFGASVNAIAEERIAGGSSGGSAVAVSLGISHLSLASDTGGSARKPAVYNGVCGIKPTYGAVSRHGLYSNAPSFDQVSPIAKTVEDLGYVLEIIAGNDGFDMTTTPEKSIEYLSKMEEGISGKVIGVEKSIMEKCKDSPVYEELVKLLGFIKSCGAEVKEVEIENVLISKDVYDLIATSEIASGFARYDGLKYTTQTENPRNVGELYKKSRSEGFGEEVKRRIMIGNYVLSQKKAYANAKNVQQLLMNNANKVLEEVSAIILPTSLTVAPKKGDGKGCEIEAILGVLANLLKAPAVSIPFAFDGENLPFGVTVVAKEGDDAVALSLADYIEKNYEGGRK